MNSLTSSEQVKIEICHNNYESHCIKAILSSFLTNNLSIVLTDKKISWEIKSQFLPVIRLISDFLEYMYEVEKGFSYSAIQKINNRRIYKLEIMGNFDQIQTDLELNGHPIKILENECCKKAYLIGAFLSGGSINSIDKTSYHFEIRSNNWEYLRTIQGIMIDFKISPVLLKRLNSYVLYVKKSDDISDLLKMLGATNVMVEYEDKRIMRDFNNQICRLNNLDIYNIKKTVEAAQQEIEWIKKIKTLGIYKTLDKKTKLFCELRLQEPNTSLKELAKILNTKYKINVTRTGLNHTVLKIKKIYNKYFAVNITK